MLIKNIVIIVFGIFLLGCDGDLKQGKCEEGFFEQNTPDGGSYCVPLGEQDSIENENPDAKKLH
ncbi:hypothetical protein [uncultured Maribacter sp.]|uniref:hypothetical protein n=1 Tax=uncultured Maribacter sp. TaxID=431308 RepID=UPI002603EF88|nr:hypothetical protein [uncultured Maribacter sp.]